jgi:trimethylamine--corrinoid protein Co-methyltransferase
VRGFRRRFPPLGIFTDEQIEEIHGGLLGVLERTGVRMDHARGLEVLQGAGCRIDRANNRVRFPADLVERSLALCPKSFPVRARDPKNDLLLGGDTLYFVSGCGMNTVDLATGEARRATKEETIDGIRVLDALENLHIHMAFAPYFGWEGLSPLMGEPEMTAAKARFSTKVQKTGSTNDSELFAIKMARIMGCDILGIVNPSPPLTWYPDAVEALLRYCEAGLPFHISSGASMGITGPASIAASTITNSAELVAGIVLAQLIKPGARIWVGNFVNATDMATGSIAFGSIGNSLTQATFNQLWRRYGVPVWSATPAYCSSKRIDFQSGYEKGIGALAAAVCGSHAIHMHGGLHAELTWHPVQAVLDDDIAGMVGRFLEGAETTEEALALDLIDRVGPIPGHYLEEEQTALTWRTLEYIPKSADRRALHDWRQEGKMGAVEIATERMANLLSHHEPSPLPPSQDEAIEEVLREARSYYRQKGLEAR